MKIKNSYKLIALVFAFLLPTAAMSFSLFKKTDWSNRAKWKIVAGKNFGPITKLTSHEELIRLLGEENIEKSSFSIGDAPAFKSTLVFKGTDREFELVWKRNKKFLEPLIVVFSSQDSVWETNKGVKLGLTVNELVEINGRDFSFWGFEWDFGGTLVSWQGGELENLKIELEDSTNSQLIYAEDKEKYQEWLKHYYSVSGDREIFSNNESLKHLDAKVVTVAIYFE